MSAPPKIDKLAPLLDYLDALTERAPVTELAARLKALDITLDDVAEFIRFDDAQYQRNLVSEARWYHLLVLCWRSGQRSPIHNHAGSTCGMRILHGVGTETVFKTTPCTLVKAVSSADLPEGTVGATQDRDIHQFSNLQAPGTDLVTLHIYSPPLLRMDTYSLTEPTIGEFRPMVHELTSGAGI